MTTSSDSTNEERERFMRRAMELARQGLGRTHPNPVVGCVIVRNGEIVAEGYHAKAGEAHAEVNALRAAGACLDNYRLPGSVLYVTLEPCTMCVGALVHARVAELVFAALEPRAGAVCSTARLLDAGHYNHRVSWRQGPLADASGELLRSFFRARRA